MGMTPMLSTWDDLDDILAPDPLAVTRHPVAVSNVPVDFDPDPALVALVDAAKAACACWTLETQSNSLKARQALRAAMVALDGALGAWR